MLDRVTGVSMAAHASVRAVFATIYDDSRRRVCELAAGLSDEQLDTRVPATPEWTARQVVAHLTGCASDALHGRMDGAPGEAWTARHVTDREGRALDAVVAEWAEVGPLAKEALAERRMPVQLVHDVLTHEADLREAFGIGPLPVDVVEAALPKVARLLVAGAAKDGALVVTAGGHELRGGSPDTEPTTVTVGPYELYRGLFSRRSRAQMRAWAWSGDAERYVDRLPVFGPRDDDQPIP